MPISNNRIPSTRILLGLLALLALSSCATAPFAREEALVWTPLVKPATFVLKDLEIATKPTTGNLKQTALDLAGFAARKAALPWGTDDTKTLYTITVSLDEREFPVDIETYNSVSAVLRIWTAGDLPEQVGQIGYSEETKKTLRSASYLAQVLDSLLGRLAEKVRQK